MEMSECKMPIAYRFLFRDGVMRLLVMGSNDVGTPFLFVYPGIVSPVQHYIPYSTSPVNYVQHYIP